jgi:hypothetical protein
MDLCGGGSADLAHPALSSGQQERDLISLSLDI